MDDTWNELELEARMRQITITIWARHDNEHIKKACQRRLPPRIQIKTLITGRFLVMILLADAELQKTIDTGSKLLYDYVIN